MYLKYSKVIKTDKYVNTTIDCVQPTRVPTCFSLHSALKKILGAWLKRDYMDLFVPLTMINRNSYIPKKKVPTPTQAWVHPRAVNQSQWSM